MHIIFAVTYSLAWYCFTVAKFTGWLQGRSKTTMPLDDDLAKLIKQDNKVSSLNVCMCYPPKKEVLSQASFSSFQSILNSEFFF